VEASSHASVPVPSPMRLAAVDVRLRLGSLVVGSLVVRVLASLGHSTPRYFPDEYIYATLGRSIGTHRDLSIRGGPAHFPALLEPLVAAPLWAASSVDTAYRLIQAENALFMSLAAIPAYLIARRLGLGQRYAFLCAGFAVAIPDLVFSSYVLGGPVAYPLVLTAFYAGLAALDRPSLRNEVAFTLSAALAAAARLEYLSLFAGFAVAAIALERRRTLRTHPLLVAALAAAGLAIAVRPSRLLGYYSGVLHLHVGADTARWVLVDLFLLSLASGVALVPGAVVALVRPAGRRQLAFSLLASAVGLVTLLEAALFASNGSDRFQERYLYELLPLIPIAFGMLELRRRRWIGVVAVGGILAAALSLDPLAGYTAGIDVMDSPFLSAVSKLDVLGAAGGSEVVAVAGTLAALVGVLLALRRRPSVAAAVSIALVALAAVGAWNHDLDLSRRVRPAYNPSWIDAQGLGDVAAIQTGGAPPASLLRQLFWNTSLTRELLLQHAQPTDAFAVEPVTISRDGVLTTTDGPLRTPFLFQGYAVGATFTGVARVAHEETFGLWKPVGTPRVRVLATGRYWDGWLAWSGRFTVWPSESGNERGVLAFTLSLPAGGRAVELRVGGRRVRVEPGRRVRIRWKIEGSGPRTIAFRTDQGRFGADLRPLSVRSTMPTLTPVRGRRAGFRGVSLKPPPVPADS
jgi:hypothetical protein